MQHKERDRGSWADMIDEQKQYARNNKDEFDEETLARIRKYGWFDDEEDAEVIEEDDCVVIDNSDDRQTLEESLEGTDIIVAGANNGDFGQD